MNLIVTMISYEIASLKMIGLYSIYSFSYTGSYAISILMFLEIEIAFMLALVIENVKNEAITKKDVNMY